MDDPPHLLLRHYILAGGQSRRFGSNKARYRIDGREMILRVADAFNSVVISTTVVGRQIGEYHDLGLTTIADDIPGAGPLAGLIAALKHAAGLNGGDEIPRATNLPPAWILLSSCDLVRPDALMLKPLLGQLGPTHQAVAYRRGDFYEPFPGLYRLDLNKTVDLVLQSKRRSFQSLFHYLGEALATIDLGDESNSLDMNIPPA